MRTSGLAIRRLNQHGQPYVHLYPCEFYIFHLTGNDQPAAVPIRGRSTGRADRVSLRRHVEQMLNEMGWELGVDGWRDPLDPSMPILATAHIYPLGERARWIPRR